MKETSLFPSVTSKKNPREKRGQNSLGSTVIVGYMNKDRVIGTVKFQNQTLVLLPPWCACPSFFIYSWFFICTITQARNLGPCMKFPSPFLSVMLATVSGQTSTLSSARWCGGILLSDPSSSSTTQPSSELYSALLPAAAGIIYTETAAQPLLYLKAY